MTDTGSEYETVIFASDANLQPLVSKKSIPGRGRGLVASGKGFHAPRETVAWIHTPLLVALDSASLQERCYQCFRQHDNTQHDDAQQKPMGGGGRSVSDELPSVVLKSCLGCHTVKYCSKNCQSRSWREGHKFECKIFSTLHPRILPSTVRAVVRVLRLRSNGYIKDKQWQALLSLESHEQQVLNPAAGKRCQDVYLMAKAAHKYSGTKEPLELVLRICCILTVNCLTLTDPVLDAVGIVLDPVAAMLNHSCEPNCVIRFDAEIASTVSNTSISKSTFTPTSTTPILGSISVDVLGPLPINEGEELTISYIDNTQPRLRRQEDLSSRYFFTCTCSRCSRGDRTPFDHHQMLVSGARSAEASEAKAYAYATEVLDTLAPFSPRHDRQSLVSRIPTISAALSRLAQSRIFPIHQYPGAQLRSQLITALIQAGRWREAALQSGILVYRIDPVLYPQQPNHPVRIINKWRLYRLVLHLFLSSLDHHNYHSATTSSSQAQAQEVVLGKTREQENVLLETTLVVTISSLQFPPRPKHPNIPSRSSLDSIFAQALADLQPHGLANSNAHHAQLFNAGLLPLLTAYKRDKDGMEKQLVTMWDRAIDAGLKSEQAD